MPNGLENLHHAILPEQADAGQALMDHIPFPIMRITADYRVQWMNRSAREVYGESLGLCYAVSHGHPSPCDSHGELCPMHQARSALAPVSVLHVHATNEGERRFKVVAVPIQDGGIIEWHIPLHDVGSIDAVTGLLTRNEVELMAARTLALMRRQGAGFAVLLIDVDHFKSVNDRYGHAVGDVVLGRVSQLIAAELRESDVVGRWGGEEFMVILPSTSHVDAIAIAERVLRRVRGDVFDGEGATFKVTLSGGVCVVPRGSSGWGFEGLVKAADECLYRAKGAGRDRLETTVFAG